MFLRRVVKSKTIELFGVAGNCKERGFSEQAQVGSYYLLWHRGTTIQKKFKFAMISSWSI